MKAYAEAVAYVRKSVAGRSDMDRSRDNQTAAIAALAERDGATIARVYDGDWGRSGGRSGRHKRSAMAELIAAVRAGSVSALYAYSLDRLARDTEYGLTLWNACADQGVPIIVDGGRFVTSDPADRMRYVITMEMSTGELDRITKRNLDIKARARINGTSLGGKLVYGSDPRHPGEDPAVVVDAWSEAGSFLGAARLLTARGVPTRHGGKWTARSVAVLVRREAPEQAPLALARKGVSAKRTRLFSNLLACGGCGSILTSMPRPGRKRIDGSIGPGSVSYYCRAEIRDTRHPAPYMISERKVLAWAKVEAEAAPVRLSVTADKVQRVAVSLDSIAAKRVAIADAVIDGLITREESRKRLAKLDMTERDGMAVRRAYRLLGAVPGVDWTLPPAEVNVALRTLWREVKLGRDMLPVEAIWVASLDD